MLFFDASTLILLAKIDLIELFITGIKGGTFITEAVRKETTAEGKEQAQTILGLIEDGKIATVKVRDATLVKRFMEDFAIDAGEAETLVAAMGKEEAVVATDDRNAIRACKLLKLDFITAIAVLIRAVEKGVVESDEALAKLQKLQSVGRYSKAIIEDAARQIQGGK
jgi:predicted nucleic acid-binding protein